MILPWGYYCPSDICIMLSHKPSKINNWQFIAVKERLSVSVCFFCVFFLLLFLYPKNCEKFCEEERRLFQMIKHYIAVLCINLHKTNPFCSGKQTTKNHY